jgi:integrase
MPAHRKQKPLPPIRIGPVSIPRYRRADGRVILVVGPERRHQTYPTVEASREAGERIATELINGGIARPMSRTELADIARARELMHQAGETAPLSEIIAAGIAARALQRERHNHTAAKIGAEMLAAKKTRDLNQSYLKKLETSLTLFATAFPGALADITPADIEAWLSTLTFRHREGTTPESSRRRDNILADIKALFRFARLRKYLPDEITAAQQLRPAKRGRPTIGIFPAATMRLLLDHCDADYIPLLVLGAFAGLRYEEIVRGHQAATSKDPLRWEDIDYEHAELCIRAETAKTGVPRRVPISDNLAAWLAPYREKTGPVIDAARRADRYIGQTGRLVRGIEALIGDDVTWPSNGLRHSYASYRMALIRNANQLVEEMGNSIAIVRKHYCVPRPKSEGESWFALYPATSAQLQNGKSPQNHQSQKKANRLEPK